MIPIPKGDGMADIKRPNASKDKAHTSASITFPVPSATRRSPGLGGREPDNSNNLFLIRMV